MEVTPPTFSLCQGQDAAYTVNTNSLGGFTGNITLSATNVPAGANLVFGTNPVSAGNSTSITIGNTAAVTPGTYSINIIGNGAPATRNTTITLTVNAVPGTIVLSAPADGMSNTSSAPSLTWNAFAGVATYQIQVATDASFSNIVFDQTSTKKEVE